MGINKCHKGVNSILHVPIKCSTSFDHSDYKLEMRNPTDSINQTNKQTFRGGKNNNT